MLQGPAYRLVTGRLMLRSVEPADAEELCALMGSNQHHLRPWIDWARDMPRTLDATLDVVRRMRGRFDTGESFSYVVIHKDTNTMIGGTMLAPVVADASATLGYWLAEASTHQGYATEAVGALLTAAFEVEHLELVEIHCAVQNERSARVATRAGFVFDGTQRARLRSEEGTRTDRMTWSMLRKEYESTRAGRADVWAFDALGRTLVEPAAVSRRGSPFR